MLGLFMKCKYRLGKLLREFSMCCHAIYWVSICRVDDLLNHIHKLKSETPSKKNDN